jgi:ATP-dependent Zn protease
MSDLQAVGGTQLLRTTADVGRARELYRRGRLRGLAFGLSALLLFLAVRLSQGNPVRLGWPTLPTGIAEYLPQIILMGALVMVMVVPLASQGRSPHQLVRSSQIDVGLDDVVGLGPVKEEVVRSLNLFLAYQTFQTEMGGTPRRGLLFEGPPGTGKTYLAKAMARDAGVPFLFVSSTAFQSSFYGMTPRRIRAYFKALRKAALMEGGAIGFIEEIDAIAGSRHGVDRAVAGPGNRIVARATNVERFTTQGDAGVVNELLMQMQSFDQPTRGQKVLGSGIDVINRLLPMNRQIPKPKAPRPNVLLIAATNRAGDLDPALLRPGRFDRSIHFDKPSRSGRREIVEFYLNRKAHAPDLARPERRDQLAAMTMGYTPVMIEHLFDESLMWALREGRTAMSWTDLQQAKYTVEIGLRQPVEYTDVERNTIATHEAGHAVIANRVGVGRKLEVLSIIKRSESLGLLAHSETEERFTQSRDELVASMQISFGGMVAEELFFGQSGTGPSGDLVAATRVAAYMVGAFGMAGSLISFEAIGGGAFSADLVGKVIADEKGRAGVDRLLADAKFQAEAILRANLHEVEALRDALLQRDELVGDEILDVIASAKAPTPG